MEAFQKRQPCFLALPEWNQLCWEIRPETTPYSYLHEEFCQEYMGQPSFSCEAIRLVSAAKPSPRELQAVINEGQRRQQRFQYLHDEMHKLFQNSGIAPRRVPSKDPTSPFQEPWQFEDIHVANMYLCYWATSCILEISLTGLKAKLLNLSPKPTTIQVPDLQPCDPQVRYPRPIRSLWEAASTLPLPSKAALQEPTEHPRTSIISLARNVGACAEWMSVQPFLGPLFLTMSLRLCLRVLPGKVERMWVVGVLQRIGKHMALADAALEEVDIVANVLTDQPTPFVRPPTEHSRPGVQLELVRVVGDELRGEIDMGGEPAGWDELFTG